jgi:hypothetical protein
LLAQDPTHHIQSTALAAQRQKAWRIHKAGTFNERQSMAFTTTAEQWANEHLSWTTPLKTPEQAPAAASAAMPGTAPTLRRKLTYG